MARSQVPISWRFRYVLSYAVHGSFIEKDDRMYNPQLSKNWTGTVCHLELHMSVLPGSIGPTPQTSQTTAAETRLFAPWAALTVLRTRYPVEWMLSNACRWTPLSKARLKQLKLRWDLSFCENGVGMRWDFWFEHVFHQSHLSMKEMGRLRANRCEFIQFHLEKVNVDRVWRLNVACLAWLVVSRLQHAGSKRTSWYTQSDLPA